MLDGQVLGTRLMSDSSGLSQDWELGTFMVDHYSSSFPLTCFNKYPQLLARGLVGYSLDPTSWV